MNESELDKGTLDWFLPLKHEAPYWRQFMAEGRTFIDVGAHVGTWTLNLAKHFKRVFAFEPDPRGWQTLKKNLAINGITNVEVIPKAVSNVNGKTQLNLFLNPCTNTMMDPAACGRSDAPIGALEVETITIDEFVKSHQIADLDFIKIDAEAAEMLIVEGALQTFRDQSPDFFVEMHGLFYERLRRKLGFLQCDVLDGGRSGLSLLRHREKWPGFATEDYRVFPHGQSPTANDMRDLRLKHGIPWEPPPGFLSVDYEDKP
jgi:FkbM family methyltransferase